MQPTFAWPPLTNFIISSIAIKEFFKSAVTWHHVLLLSIALPVILGKKSPLKFAFPRQLLKQVLNATNWLPIGLPFVIFLQTLNAKATTKGLSFKWGYNQPDMSLGTKIFSWPCLRYLQSFIKVDGLVLEKNAQKAKIWGRGCWLCNQSYWLDNMTQH